MHRFPVYSLSVLAALLVLTVGSVRAQIPDTPPPPPRASKPDRPPISEESLTQVKRFLSRFRKFSVFEKPVQMPEATFADSNADPATWEDFKGKHVLFSFWATWCPPCLKELNFLDALQRLRGGETFEVAAISVDLNPSLQGLKSTFRHYEVTDLPLYYDPDQEIIKHVPIDVLPTSFLLDPEGNVLYRFVGDVDWTTPEGLAFIDLATSGYRIKESDLQ